jgi:putative ABC transport system permease protein
VAIVGLPFDARLNRVIDVSGRAVTLPEDGLVLSTKLAEILGVARGETVTIDVLEGGRPTYRAAVTDLVEEYMGTTAYMEISALHRLLREGDSLSGAYLQIDAGLEDALYRRLKNTPAVAGVALKRATIENFQETIAQNITLIVFFNVLFSSIIACGVVYNAALISLSERSRELASLRVLGFTRAEISFILLGELALLTAVAVPAGMLLGYVLSALTVQAFDTELYRIPLAIAPKTYAWSALVVGGASALSALAVRRRLDRLDLIAVLKAPE